MYVCIYVRMYVRTYVRIYNTIYVVLYIRLYINVCMYVCMYIGEHHIHICRTYKNNNYSNLNSSSSNIDDNYIVNAKP